MLAFFLPLSLYGSMKLVAITKTMSENLVTLLLEQYRRIYHRITVRGSRVSGIAAMTTKGILAYILTTDTVNGDHFLNFLAADLIPQMTAFDGSDVPLIIIMHITAVCTILKK